MTRSRGVKAPPYSLREDRIILAMVAITGPDRECLLPGRSAASIRQRRQWLRRQGLTLATISAHHHRESSPEPDPASAPGGTLPDWMIWEIVQEMGKPDGERRSWAQMARDLNVKRDVVANQVYRLRDGWTCPLTHVPCRVCGEIVIARAWGPPVSTHPGCMPQRKADDLRAWAEPIQDETREHAVHHRQRWTIAEDRYILDHWDDRAEDVARDLNRTLYAVNARRHTLRKRYAARVTA